MKCRPLFFPYVALDPLRAPDGKSVRARWLERETKERNSRGVREEREGSREKDNLTFWRVYF